LELFTLALLGKKIEEAGKCGIPCDRDRRDDVYSCFVEYVFCSSTGTSIVFHGVMVTSMLVIQELILSTASAPSSILGERDHLFALSGASKSGREMRETEYRVQEAIVIVIDQLISLFAWT
jgi:hypothetical protein